MPILTWLAAGLLYFAACVVVPAFGAYAIWALWNDAKRKREEE